MDTEQSFIKTLWKCISSKTLYIFILSLSFSLGSVALVQSASISGTTYESNGLDIIAATNSYVFVYTGDPCGNRTHIQTVDTNLQNGEYVVDNLAGGTYFLEAAADSNYVREWWTSPTTPTSSFHCIDATSITVAEEDVVRDKDFQLDKGGFITGTIYGSDEQPLTGAPIYVNVQSGNPCGQNQHVIGGSVNTTNGTYIINGIPAGIYSLRIWRNNTEYVEEWWTGADGDPSNWNCNLAQTITVTAGVTEEDKDFQLEEGGTISGTVNGSNGQPLTGVPVHVNVQFGNPCGQFQHVRGSGDINTTNGTYTITGIPTGTFHLNTWNNNTAYIDEWWTGAVGDPSNRDCNMAQTITVSEGVTEPDIDFKLEEGGTISGTISDENGLIDGSQNNMGVDVFTGNACGWHEHVMSTGLETSGMYNASGLQLNGQYLLRTYSNNTSHINEWFAGFDSNSDPISSQHCEDAVLVSFTGGVPLVDNVDFELEEGGTISGTISDGDGLIDGSQNDIGVSVFTGDACGHTDHVMGNGLNSDGTYNVRGLQLDGQYLLRTYSNDTSLINEWFAGFDNNSDPISSQHCADAVLVSFTGGVDLVDNVDFQLEEGGTISGTVYDGSDPINGDQINIGVAAYTGDACGQRERISDSALDASGVYNIRGIQLNGQYLIRTYSNDTSYIEEWFAGFDNNSDPISSQNCEDAVLIGFPQDEPIIEEIDFELEEGGTIIGTIFDGSEPIDGNQYDMGVSVFTGDDACGQIEHIMGRSIDGSGTYNIRGLQLGDQYLLNTYSDDSPYMDEWFAGFDNDDNPVSSQNCEDAVPVSFTGGATLVGNIDFQLEEGALIEGSVTNFSGDPVTNSCINVFTEKCGDWRDIEISHSNTDQSGNYHVVVPPGRGYYIFADPACNPSSTQIPEYWNGFPPDEGSSDCNQAVETPVTAIGTPVQNINFQLEEGAIILGTISGTYGQRVCVNAYKLRSNGQNGCDTSWAGGGQTEANGTYSFTTPAGNYFLGTDASCGDNPNTNYLIDEYWIEGGQGTLDCSSASEFPVVAGPNPSKNIALGQGGNISGNLYEEDGSQLTDEHDIRVDVYIGNPCDYNRVDGGNVNESTGAYTTNVIATGNYFIKVNHTTVHPESWWTTETATGTTTDCTEASPVPVNLLSTTTGKDFNLPRDTDGDSISDSDEINIYHTNHLLTDTDGDGIPDDGEVYLWGDDFNGDIDADGVWNIAEHDADNDGTSDLQEMARGADMRDAGSTPPDLVLYDDFSSGTLDPTKWDQGQYVREIHNNSLQLLVDAPFDAKSQADMVSTAVQNVKTTFTINELNSNVGGSAYFNLSGLYYHENVDISTVAGLVYAGITIGDFGSGLEVEYYIGHFINEAWEIAEISSGSVVAAGGSALAIGSQYQLEIKYDGTNGFIFTIYNGAGDEEIGTASDTGSTFTSSIENRRGIKVQVRDKGGRVSVSAGYVETSDGSESYSVYDNFEGPHLDSSRWLNPGYVKAVTADERLRMLSHSFGDRATTRLHSRERYNYIETTVQIDSSSFQNEGTKGRARLEGFLYNESRGPGSGLPYSGYEGNVWGQIAIAYTETDGLYAFAYAERVNSADYSSYEQIFYEKFSMPVSFDTEYTFYIGFGGDFMVFGIDGADGSHAMGAELINTPNYLPYKPRFSLLSRTYSNGNEGRFLAHYDNVKVSGEPLEKAGDINVDGNIDLADVILGLQTLTGDATMQAWAAGDVNYDGVIGLPEVIDVMNQISIP